MNLKHILFSERNQIGYLLGFHLTCRSERGRTVGQRKAVVVRGWKWRGLTKKEYFVKQWDYFIS